MKLDDIGLFIGMISMSICVLTGTIILAICFIKLFLKKND